MTQHLWTRLLEAKSRLKPVQSKYRVLFENPATPEPIGAMTEEEAIEYLIQKDIPPQVWRDYQGNRAVMKIVPVELIPSDRSFRNAWKINQEMEMAA